MFVRDQMTRHPLTVRPDDSIRKARVLMREGQVRRLPVVEGDRLVGIVTLGDIFRRSPAGPLQDDGEPNILLDHVLVGGVMSLKPLVTSPDSDLVDAARMMLERKVGALPVLEHGQLVGILTETDVLQALITTLEPEQQELVTKDSDLRSRFI
jgi:acetoin utilization protein AcuB